MNTTPIKWIGLALTLLVFISYTHAQNVTNEPTSSTGGHMELTPIENESGLRAFLDAYVAAINAKDVKKIKAMIHPKDLAAWTDFLAHQPAAPGQTKPTLDESLLLKAIPENHPPFIVQRFLKDSPLPQAGFMDWPIPPTHEVQFTWKTGPNSSRVFILELVHAGTQWFVVRGVPNADFIKKMTGGK